MTSRYDVLAFIRWFQAKNGLSPTVREIAKAIGRVPSSVHAHLDSLEREGLIVRQAGKARTLKVVAK